MSPDFLSYMNEIKLSIKFYRDEKEASPYASVGVPLIKRAFPQLLSDAVVGVQPMSAPTGLAYALKQLYQDDEIQNTPTPKPAKKKAKPNHPFSLNPAKSKCKKNFSFKRNP